MWEKIKKRTGLSQASRSPRVFNRWMGFFISLFFIAAFIAIYLMLTQKPDLIILTRPASTAVETTILPPKFLRTPAAPLPTSSLWDNGND